MSVDVCCSFSTFFFFGRGRHFPNREGYLVLLVLLSQTLALLVPEDLALPELSDEDGPGSFLAWF